MNEGIDIAFMGAKLAASKNESASVAVHGVSVAYNLAQMASYRYAYCYGQRLLCDGSNVDIVRLEQYRQDMVKHTILAVLDIASLLIMGLSSFQRNR